MPKFHAKVHVRLKPSVLDPQGKAVEQALSSLGFKETRDVRVGKFFELEVDAASENAATSRVRQMADTLLSNPVIEDYAVSVDGSPRGEAEGAHS